MEVSGAVPHVVVVDDDPLIRALVEAFLEKLGCRRTLCPDAASARAAVTGALASGTTIHLVLLDLWLGRTSGLDVCRDLRRAGVGSSIVGMSGDPGAFDRATYEEAGLDDVLAKPIGFEDLEACIRSYAGRRHAAP